MNESFPMSALQCIDPVALEQAGVTKFPGPYRLVYHSDVLIVRMSGLHQVKSVGFARITKKPLGYLESIKINLFCLAKPYSFIPSPQHSRTIYLGRMLRMHWLCPFSPRTKCYILAFCAGIYTFSYRCARVYREYAFFIAWLLSVFFYLLL